MIAVLAGSLVQFRQWEHANPGKVGRYIDDVSRVRGVHFTAVECYGTWRRVQNHEYLRAAAQARIRQ